MTDNQRSEEHRRNLRSPDHPPDSCDSGYLCVKRQNTHDRRGSAKTDFFPVNGIGADCAERGDREGPGEPGEPSGLSDKLTNPEVKKDISDIIVSFRDDDRCSIAGKGERKRQDPSPFLQLNQQLLTNTRTCIGKSCDFNETEGNSQSRTTNCWFHEY